jgi:mevalonate kinase
MKKIISALLVLVMLIGCALTLTSCAKPELNFEKAKANLEKAGYDVKYSAKASELKSFGYLGLVEALEAENDDGEEIVIAKFDKTKTAKLYIKEQEMSKDRQIEYIKYEIKAMEHMLRTYEEQYSADEIKELNEERKEAKEALEAMKEEFIVGRSGKTVWYGTKAAVEASRG